LELNKDLPKNYLKELSIERQRALQKREKNQKTNQRRVLLVGGAGYIGSILTGYLLQAGYQVRCLDLLIYDNKESVSSYRVHNNYEFIQGDLCDESCYGEVLSGVSDVILLAGLVGDPITKKYPKESKRINEEGLSNFINSLNGKGINKVVFISTCSNYGLIKDSVAADENFELNPLSLYSCAKVNLEKLILSLKRSVDYDATVLRFATAFGLSGRMRFDLTVNEFTRDLYLKNDLLVYDAHTWRPYCHVKDFSDLINKVLEAPIKMINTGVYVIEPEVIDMFPHGTKIDMNEVIEIVQSRGKVSVFPISEGWIDIGQWDEFRKNIRNFEN